MACMCGKKAETGSFPRSNSLDESYLNIREYTDRRKKSSRTGKVSSWELLQKLNCFRSKKSSNDDNTAHLLDDFDEDDRPLLLYIEFNDEGF